MNISNRLVQLAGKLALGVERVNPDFRHILYIYMYILYISHPSHDFTGAISQQNNRLLAFS